MHSDIVPHNIEQLKNISNLEDIIPYGKHFIDEEDIETLIIDLTSPNNLVLDTDGLAQVIISITDDDAMLAGLEISKLEGIIPAIETAHAFAAFNYLDFKSDDIIVVNFSGRGDKDLNTYIDYFNL